MNIKKIIKSRETRNKIVSFFRFIPDKLYLKLMYRLRLGKKLNLKNPQTFNEKLQWLKLYDRKPEYIQMVDKYEAKKYVSDRIGEEYIIPTYGVWSKFDDIDFNSLPNQFVLKCTHDSGGLVICKDKSAFDIKAARVKINKSLKSNFYYIGREWPYKNVKPRIIAEKYMVDESGYELKDYKVFNFNGEAKIIQVDFNRFVKHTKNLYSTGWDLLNVQMNYPSDPETEIERPKKLELMLELAAKLSKDIPYVRTDFYSIDDKVYFGEITFYPASGFAPFTPKKYDKKFGEWIKLPESSGGGYLVANKGYILWIHEGEPNIRLTDSSIKDYKFFCFNGMAKCFKIDFDRFIEHHANYYDRDKNLLNFGEKGCPPDFNRDIGIPKNIDKMMQLAEELSKVSPFLRADFYDVNGEIYFGEMTFYPASGFGKFIPEDWDKKLGEWIKLPESRGGGYLISDGNIVVSLQKKENIAKETGLTDYKFYCFNGEPKYLYVSSGLENHATARISFLTMQWEMAPFGRSDYKPFDALPDKPSLFPDMVRIAEKLSQGHDFLRVDLYQINNKIYFSELTFCPAGGFMPFVPEEWDKKLGDQLQLHNLLEASHDSL